MQVVYLHLKKGTHDKEATKPLEKEVERRKYRKKNTKLAMFFVSHSSLELFSPMKDTFQTRYVSLQPAASLFLADIFLRF